MNENENETVRDESGTEQEQGQGEAPQELPVRRAPRGLLGSIRKRLPSGPDALKAGSLIHARKASFLFDGSAGAPGFFVDDNGEYVDVELTMQSISSADEINAMSQCKEAVEAPYMLAKEALCEVEGEPIRPEEKDLIWEALGPVGRQLCLMAMQHIGNTSESAMGKYQRTFSVG